MGRRTLTYFIHIHALAVFGAVFVAGCAADFAALDRRTLPRPEAYPDAAAVVLEDESEVRFGIDGAGDTAIADETRAMRILILRPSGAKAAKIVVPYDPRHAVTDFRARTVAPDGRVRRYVRRDAVDLPRIGGSLYTDARMLVLEAEPSMPGTVVEYRFTRRSVDPRPIGFERVMERDDPVAHVRFAIEAPEGCEVEHLAVRLGRRVEGFEPAIVRGGGRLRLAWEQRDLTALPDHDFTARESERGTRIVARLRRCRTRGASVEALPDFPALSAWAFAQQAPARAPTPSTRALASELLKDVPPGDPIAATRRLHAWVRDHVRYCSIDIGAAGWIPHAPGDVARLRYGDCKDKANLLGALLADRGIPSRIVALYAHDGLPAHLDMPVLGGFNHAILEATLPSGPVLLDPTAPTVPFGELPFVDQEADLLPLVEGGAALRPAPSSAADANEDDIALELAPDPAGTWRGAVTIRTRGGFAERLRMRLLETLGPGRTTAIERWIGATGAWAGEIRIEDLSPGEGAPPLVVHAEVATAQALAMDAAGGVFRLAELFRGLVPQGPEPDRDEPWVVRFRQTSRLRVRLRLPDGWAPIALPAPIAFEGPLGRYDLAFRWESGALVAERRLELREHVVEKPAFPSLRALLDAATAGDARPVVLARGGRR